MKRLCIIPILLLSLITRSQLPKDITFYYNDYSFGYQPSRENSNTPLLIIAVPKSIKKPIYLINGRYKPDSLESSKLFQLTNDSTFFKAKIPGRVAISYDTTPVEIFIQGINKANASQYEYRMIDSLGKTISEWLTPKEFLNGTFVDGYGENDPEMAHIGPLRSRWNSFIKIEIKEKNGPKIIGHATIFWLAEKPEVAATFKSDSLNNFFRFLDFSSKNEGGFNRWTDGKELKLLSKEHTFSADQDGIVFLLKDLIHKNIIEYKITNGSTDIQPWKRNEFDFNFIWLKSLKPGKYTLQLRYTMQPENISEYNFEIKPTWYQSGLFKIIVGVIALLLFGSLILFIRQRRQKTILNRQLLEKEKKALELRAVRSQLNPHFIFNALNSIQGLMNSNKMEEANKYLSDFSALLRDTLSGNTKDYNPLQVELELMDRYLKLEKLRFHFQYSISVDSSINSSTIEVPTLIMQPLVENAVKHGVAGLLDKGLIQIIVRRNNNNISISIIDNGSGFNEPGSHSNGHGIKLTKERAELINQMHKQRLIEVSFEKKPTGMEANLNFNEIC